MIPSTYRLLLGVAIVSALGLSSYHSTEASGPKLLRWGVEPAVISPNEEAIIYWEAENADYCRVSRAGTSEHGGSTISAKLGMRGTLAVYPAQTRIYTVWCAGAPGSLGKEGRADSARLVVEVDDKKGDGARLDIQVRAFEFRVVPLGDRYFGIVRLEVDTRGTTESVTTDFRVNILDISRKGQPGGNILYQETFTETINKTGRSSLITHMVPITQIAVNNPGSAYENWYIWIQTNANSNIDEITEDNNDVIRYLFRNKS